MRAWNYLSSGFTNLTIPTYIQKRLYKFLLRKAIGQFISTELDLENFDIELVNGSVELRDLDLNLETLNELLIDTPFMLVQGHVSTITALLPWSNFWSGDVTLKVHGLRLTLKPINEKRKKSFTTDEEESPIMSSSLHFADDFLRTEMEPDQNKELYESIQQLHEADKSEVDFGLEGLQIFTRIIDKMLAKVKVDISDTIIRIMHPSAVTLAGDHQYGMNVNDREYALDIEIPKISYFDESPCFTDKPSTVLTSNMIESTTLLPNSGDDIIKIIMITSPKIWMRSIDIDNSTTTTTTPTSNDDDEILLNNRDDDDDDDDMNGLAQTEFYEASEGGSKLYNNNNASPHSSFMSGSATPRAYSFQNLQNMKPYEALLFTTMNKENWIRFKTKATSPFDTQTPNFNKSIMNSIDIYFSHIRMMIAPKQLSFLLDLFTSIPTDSPNSASPLMNEKSSNESRLNKDEMFKDQRRKSSIDSLSPHSVLKDLESYQQQQQQYQHPHTSNNNSTTNISIDQQFNINNPLKLSTPSATISPSSPQIPNIKVKLQISIIEMYLLYDDSSILTPNIWESTISPPTTKTSHIKFWMNQFIIRLQFFSQQQNYNKKRNSVAGSTLSQFDKSFQSSSKPSTSSSSKKSSFILSSVLDTRIQSMGIDEWISESQCPLTTNTTNTPSSSIRMRYDRYNPILEFTDSICNDYGDDNHIFPSYLFQSEPTIATSTNTDHEKYTKSKKEVIRIKIEKFCKPSLNPCDGVIFYNQDINADIQALKLTLDPKIIDRLENYVYAFLMSQKQNDQSENKNSQPSYTEQPFDRKIYEDLNKVSNEYQNQIHTKIKFSLIRLVLYAPDMSQSNTRDEYNDLYHGDILSVDIKKITASWKTDNSISQIEKIIVDLDMINVFLKLAKDNEFRCWFTAKSREKNNLSSAVSSSPSMEISLRSSTMNTPYTTSSAARSCFFGTGSDIPNGLFEHLSRNETFYCEQKVSAPMEEQAESSMVFKQRTVETSTIVVNCHLPITYMSLPKKTWDKVQIIQNDLLLWQPRFIRYLEQHQQGSADSMMAESMNSEILNSHSGRRYSDISTNSINQLRASSIFSQSFEHFHEPQQHIQQKSSLLSLVVVMSEGIWNLQTTSKDNKMATYQLQFSDFRYFTVVNHLGKNENVTTLDIENLTLDDVTNGACRIPLINKTLPKSLIPKRNIPMVSLLSRLTAIPELNKQNKLTSVVACNICWRFTPDVTFLENLIGFQKAPEDLVFIDPPTQYIKVFAHVLDTSLDYKPLNIPSRAVIVVDNLQVITDILAGKPILDVKTFILNVDMLLADDVDDMDEKSVQQISSRSWDPRRYWLKSGMSSVLTSRNLDTHVKIKLDEMALAPSIDLAILNDILTLEGCSDSFQSLLNFINYVASDGDEIFSKQQQPSNLGDNARQKEKTVKKATHVLRKTKEDMLASLDEDAFGSRRRQSSITQPSPLSSSSSPSSPPPFATDLNLIEGFYLGSGSSSTPSRKNTSRPNKPKRRNFPTPPHHHKKTTEDIIRLLIHDVQELDIVENFYSINQKKENRHKVVDTRHSLFSVRVRDVDIIWKLYNGYDWSYIRSNVTSPSTSFSPNLNHQRRRSSNDPSFSSSSNIPKSHSPSMYNNNNGDSISKTSELGTSFNRSSPFAERSSPNQHHRAHSISSSPRTIGSLERSSPVHYHHQQHPHEVGSHHGSDDFHYSSPSSYESKYSFSQSPTHHRRQSQQQRHHHHHQRAGPPDIELRIEGICLELDMMAPEEQTCLHAHLSIRDLEIVDNIKTSSWDTLLGYMRSESPSRPPRETDSNMITFDVTGIKPIKDDDTLEYRLRIHILPLRFYIDQDALNFLVQFFSFNQDLLHSTVGANLASSKNRNHSSLDTDDHNKNDNGLFFQHVEIHPLHLKIDYKPKYINYDNIKEGQFAELVNLFRLEDAKLNLSAVKMTGIKGIPKLLDRLGQEWLPHIKNTQIPGMVTGISPIRSVVNLGTGVANLVLLPIQQYRKDGRIIKGLQKGTQSFAKTTAMELIKLSARLALGTQVILEHADGLLSYGHSNNNNNNHSTTTNITPSSSSGLGSRNNHHDNELRDGMPSSSISSISTVIGSRTNDDMVLIITDKNIESEQDEF